MKKVIGVLFVMLVLSGFAQRSEARERQLANHCTHGRSGVGGLLGAAGAACDTGSVSFSANGAVSELSRNLMGSASSSPGVVPAPANIVAGNALVFVIGVYGATPGIGLPSGFALIGSAQTASASGNTWTQEMGCKTATGAEPGSYSATWTNGDSHGTAAILQLAGTDCAHIDVNAGVSAGGVATATIPSLTTGQSNEFIVAAGSWDCGIVPGISTGRLFVSNGSLGRLVIAGYAQLAAGATPAPIIGTLNPLLCSLSGNTITGQQVGFYSILSPSASPLLTNASGQQLQTLNGSINNVLNVMAPPYGALGDGNTDDLNAIQKAIYDACGLPNPPSGSPVTQASTAVFLPPSPVCYMHSKPLRIPCQGLEFYGQQAALCQNYTGVAILQNGWGVGNLPTTTALVGSGKSLISAGGQIYGINIGRFINGPGTNNLKSNVTSNGFNIALFMKPTATNGQVFSSIAAYPGPYAGADSGAFSFIFNGSSQLVITVNTVTGGKITVGTCAAQSAGTIYELELDWDKTTYRAWQGIPGRTAASCGTAASSNAMVQNPFEEVMLPDGGPHQYWPDSSNNTASAFAGELDSVRIQNTSVHTSAYTVPNTKFAADGNTYYLQNFDTSLDGTQIGYTYNGASVYSIIGETTIGATSGDNLHDLELCSTAGGSGSPDGLWVGGSNNSKWKNLTCSNAYFAQFEFFAQDYLAHADNLQGFGGHVGIIKANNFADSIVSDSGIDGVDIACEVANGGGGGSYTESNPRCVDRGGLRYGWIENATQTVITYPFVDQELGVEPQFVATYLINSPFSSNVITGGNIDTRNGAPYILQDNGGYGSAIVGMLFGTYGEDQLAGQVVKYTNGNPISPTQLISSVCPTTGGGIAPCAFGLAVPLSSPLGYVSVNGVAAAPLANLPTCNAANDGNSGYLVTNATTCTTGSLITAAGTTYCSAICKKGTGWVH